MSESAVQSQDTVTIEIDGQSVECPKGSMIIEAADRIGVDIPRFCYHRKLSIAANCRMCLVDVEKAPKPMPACATPVMDGMKVYTDTRRAIDAQHGVMEFLLINHPLDCPICDQGGECELQDLAMGYGRSISRFTERKRVVADRDIGPLVQTDMTRCIHCTRCIRFLDEIAGTNEMGGAGRGDRLEIGTCVQNSIDSELSGNIIDLCPVGALTNKPFRFGARAWELLARPSVAVHDGVGSNVFHHVRRGRIMRTVPRDNEAANETWLSDRDRFGSLGLYSDERLLQPMIKSDGQWREATWDEAIEAAADMLRGVQGGDGRSLGTLMSPSASTEEYFLAQRLVRELGSANIDHRLRQADFSDDGATPRSPVFSMPIAGIPSSDAIVLLGCNPRLEAPLIGHRIRKAWRSGASIGAVNPMDWDFHFDLDWLEVVPPQALVRSVAVFASAVAKAGGLTLPEEFAALAGDATVSDEAQAMAGRLMESSQGLVMIGQTIFAHPSGGVLRAMAAWIARETGSALNLLQPGGNAVGAWAAGAVPHRGPAGAHTEPGLDARGMLTGPCRNFLLWNVEPAHDIDNPALALSALGEAERVVAVAEFAGEALKSVADVLLPLAPAAESAGTYHNFDGLAQSVAPAGDIGGDARPGWKILRRLGGSLGLDGFEYVDLAAVQADMASILSIEAGDVASAYAPGGAGSKAAGAPEEHTDGLWRIGEVAVYSVDATCRRSDALQQAHLADVDHVEFNAVDASRLGIAADARVTVKQGDGSVDLVARIHDGVPAGAVRVFASTDGAARLGASYGPIEIGSSSD